MNMKLNIIADGLSRLISLMAFFLMGYLMPKFDSFINV